MSFLGKLKDSPWEKVKLWKNHFRTGSNITTSSKISTDATSDQSVFDATDESDRHVDSNVDIIMKTLKRDVSKLLAKSESKTNVTGVIEKIDRLEECIRSICDIQNGLIKHPCVRDEFLQEHKDMIVSLVQEITEDLDKHWNKVRKEKKSVLGHSKRGIESVLELVKDEVVKMVDILVAKKSFFPCTFLQSDKYSTPSNSYLKDESSFQSVFYKRSTMGNKPNKCQSEPTIPKSSEQTKSIISKKSKEATVSKQTSNGFTKFTDVSNPENLSKVSYANDRKFRVDPSSNFAMYECNISKLKKKSSNIINMRNKYLASQKSSTYFPSNTSTTFYTLAQSSVDPIYSTPRLLLDSSRRIGVSFAEIVQNKNCEISEDTYYSCLPTKEPSKKEPPSVEAEMVEEARGKCPDTKEPSWNGMSMTPGRCTSNDARSVDSKPGYSEAREPSVARAASYPSTEALTRISPAPYRTIALNTDSMQSLSRPTISKVSFASSHSPPTGVRPIPSPAPVISQRVILDSKFSKLYLANASVSHLCRENGQ